MNEDTNNVLALFDRQHGGRLEATIRDTLGQNIGIGEVILREAAIKLCYFIDMFPDSTAPIGEVIALLQNDPFNLGKHAIMKLLMSMHSHRIITVDAVVPKEQRRHSLGNLPIQLLPEFRSKNETVH